MEHNVFSVMDKKAGAFHPPFMESNKATAMRRLADLVNGRNGPDHIYCVHPLDFQLCILGTFDDLSGEYVTYSPEQVCGLHELVETE